MTAQRGRHLIAADRGLATGGGLLAWLFTRGFNAALARIDLALQRGRIDLRLPDGRQHRLGGHGSGPIARVELDSWRALARLISSGSVGWYKAWAQREWSSPDPVALFEVFSLNAVTLGEIGRAKGPWKWLNHLAHRLRANAPARARRNIAHHYDLGNDFYAAWLDATMTYSCAIFAEPIAADEPLESAQDRKIRMLLDRLQLRPGQRLLEIGCGWGSLAEIAARELGVKVVGLTLSPEQKAYADRRMQAAGLEGQVEIRLADYRDLAEGFDAIASVEMVEAVGREYWPAYLQCIARSLPAGGRAALQLISIAEPLFERYAANADFIQTYVFPGGLLVSEEIFRTMAGDTGLAWQGRKGFGAHYAETLRRWRQRYDAAVVERKLPDGFDAAFHDLWRYYLMYCEGGFRGGGIDVAQITLVKG